MKILTKITIIGIIGLLAFSCKEKATNSDESPPISFSAQSSKCLSQGLPKGLASDSVFSYSFNDNLTLDFSVSANCCPDSSRFSINQIISNDTLIVLVSDTAEDQCHCLCPYMIHAEYGGLPQDHYVVRCIFYNPEFATVIDPIHLVNVLRTK